MFAAGAWPPCETWSISRYQELEDGGGPSPLRSAVTPWGLPHLAKRDLDQVRLANLLLQVSLTFGLELLIRGGSAFIEHPAFLEWHTERGATSIWKLPEMLALVSHPDASLITFEQSKLGARSRKPTTLLLVRLEGFHSAFAANQVRGPSAPLQVLTGCDETGAFRTLAAKEYPPRMNRVIAEALVAQASSIARSRRYRPVVLAESTLDVYMKSFVPLDPYLQVDIGADCALFNRST